MKCCGATRSGAASVPTLTCCWAAGGRWQGRRGRGRARAARDAGDPGARPVRAAADRAAAQLAGHLRAAAGAAPARARARPGRTHPVRPAARAAERPPQDAAAAGLRAAGARLHVSPVCLKPHTSTAAGTGLAGRPACSTRPAKAPMLPVLPQSLAHGSIVAGRQARMLQCLRGGREGRHVLKTQRALALSGMRHFAKATDRQRL